jgi:hypothetical protein
MVGFNLVQDAISGLNALNTYRPLQLLGGAAHLKVFSPQQLEAMALLSLNAHPVGFAVALISSGVRASPRAISPLPLSPFPTLIGEPSFAAWLTVRGVDVAKWKEMAARSRK